MFQIRKFLSLGSLCLLLIAGILAAGLWPFNFIPSNKVSWLPADHGVRFYGQGIVYSREPLKRQDSVPGDAGITIAFQIRPDKQTKESVDTILTINDQGRERFLFSQRHGNFGVRVPSPHAQGKDRYRYMGVGDLFRDKDRFIYIAISSNSDRTDIYADGKLRQSVQGISLVPGGQFPSGRLLLGNSPNGIHPWQGTVFGLAIYDRALTGAEILVHYTSWMSKKQYFPAGGKHLDALYLFDERRGEMVWDHSGRGNHLVKPEIFRPLERHLLHFPTAERFFKSDTYLDIVVNIIGFIPVGFALSAWLLNTKELPAMPAYILAAVLGLLLSLTIELSQIFLPTRDSSSLDLLTNTLGTVLGIVLHPYTEPFLHKTLSRLLPLFKQI